MAGQPSAYASGEPGNGVTRNGAGRTAWRQPRRCQLELALNCNGGRRRPMASSGVINIEHPAGELGSAGTAGIIGGTA